MRMPPRQTFAIPCHFIYAFYAFYAWWFYFLCFVNKYLTQTTPTSLRIMNGGPVSAIIGSVLESVSVNIPSGCVNKYTVTVTVTVTVATINTRDRDRDSACISGQKPRSMIVAGFLFSRFC